MSASLERQLDGLLAKVGGGEAEDGATYRPSRLSDPEFYRLRDLVEKASQEGRPDGRNLTEEERERVRQLLSRMFTGGDGETRVEPWLLSDEDLERLHALRVQGENPRNGSFEPSRLSPEEREEYLEVTGRARVGVSI